MAERQTLSQPDQDIDDSPPRLVRRLVGMETEYATLIANRPEKSSSELPASVDIYKRICEAIGKEQPTVRGVYDRNQFFLASGAAVTFESHPSLHALPGGLVEVATPEVNSPDELLACQRSIDCLVADAAEEVGNDLDLRVLKNSSDALGHIYGCQENYEADVATGVWLIAYRACVVVLWILQLISLAMSVPLIGLTFASIALLRFFRRGDSTVGDDSNAEGPSPGSQSAADLFEMLPGWVKSALMGASRIIHTPTVLFLRFVVRRVAFRKQRKYLTAMLVSRVALCGAGDLDHDGRYRLSPKAMAIDVISDMGCYNGERPIFVFGHWLGQFCAKSFLSLGSTREMFRRRQRIQIGLSDSNLSQLAEYVKFGSVSLVLDMIERGDTKLFITIPRPVKALQDIASDWNLVRRVMTSRGRMSALEIQKRYLDAAREFVERVDADHHSEAALVVERWTELLDVVTAYRRDARNTGPALGRVDWLSKRWMMDQLGDNADWSARKKTDLRYHELSPDGYYQKLAATNPSLALVDEAHAERRRRTPPSDSPATKRGWLIREFGSGEESVTADWSFAFLGDGKEKKRIEFDV